MKRFLIVLLSLVMVVSLFAGCDSSDNETKPDTETPSSEVETNTDPTAGIDFEGGTVKFACWADYTPVLGKDALGDAQYYAEENAKKKYNVGKMEYYVSSGDKVQKEEFVKAALAGTHYADIFVAHCWYIGEYIQNDLVYDLTDYVTTYDPDHFNLNLTKFYGKVWGIRTSYSVPVPNSYFTYNTDLIKQCNLTDPQELDLQGKWTWDVFTDYCKEASKIDGVKGVGAFNINQAIYNSANVFNSYYDETDGRYYNSYQHADTKDLMASCLDFANRLVNVEKVMLGTFCAGRDAGNQRTEAFKDSKLMFCFGNIAELKTQGTIQYKPVQFPTPEENYERYNTINEYTMQTIPVSANYPVKDLAYFWMDRCCVWDENAGDAYYELDYEEKIEELYATAFLTREDAEYMVECGKKLKGEIVSPADGLGSLAIWNLFNPVMEGSKSVAQVIEENAQAMQASIDKNLNSYIDEKK